MKQHAITRCLLLLSPLLLACNHEQKPADEPVQVLTFNIRLDAPTDSLNNWANRKDNVAELITYYAPDLMGMQEVLPNQLADLRQALPEYTAIGVGRDDGKDAGEHCPIFYRTERFELLRQGDFSLSENPGTFGVRGWDASYNRVCTWALLRDKLNDKRIAYFNTHLDNDGEVARREGISLVLERMKAIAPDVQAIITGDFNCGPGEGPMQVLANNGMTNASAAAKVAYGPQWSFHDFGRIPLEKRPLLDYVYVTAQTEVSRYRVIQDTPDSGYYSDHNPVLVSIKY